MLKSGWLAVVLATLCLSAWGQAQVDKRYPITARLVARALSNHGLETADEQVTLLAEVTATEAYPVLEVLSVEPQTGPGAARTTVKLGCQSTANCLPFFATITGAQPAVTPAAEAGAAHSPITSFAARARANITMPVGTHAVLFMDDRVAHIQVAVVTLEAGDIGKKIRVASPDHKQIYRGEVVNGNQLRGEF